MFQNSSTYPIHVKIGQILGHANTGGPTWTVESEEQIDWTDIVQPGMRSKTSGSCPPTHVSSKVYMAEVAGGEGQSLTQCLNFLADEIVDKPKLQENIIP